MKKKKDIIAIIILLIILFLVLVVIISSKNNNHSDKKDNIVEEQEEPKDRFPDYELKESAFRSDTNQELKTLFEQEDISASDIKRVSNSMINGYIYLLENKTGTVNIKDLNEEEIGRLASEFLYTNQEKVCTDMCFMEEYIYVLFGDIDLNLENDTEHFNIYNNSYCVKRNMVKSKYSLVYDSYSSKEDYVVVIYKELENGNEFGTLKVYFKKGRENFFIEKIEL